MTKDWTSPLIIRQRGKTVTVSGPAEALELLNLIPVESRGYLFDLGKRRLEGNIAGDATESAAKLAFQAALNDFGAFPGLAE
jgi:hypothetical protein